MTYKLENVPEELDRARRARAAAEHKSLEQTILDAVARELGVGGRTRTDQSDIGLEEKQEQKAAVEDSGSVMRRDLSDIAGKRTIDDEARAVFEELRRIDPGLWR